MYIPQYTHKLSGRLVTSSSFVSTSIRIITRCDYSHIEFKLDNGETLGAQAASRGVVGGVRIRPLNYTTFTKVKNFEIDVTELQKVTALNFGRKQIGKDYDYLAIGGILVDRDWRDDSKWFCSELFTRTLEVAGIINRLDYAINHVTPAHDLLILSSMAKVHFLN